MRKLVENLMKSVITGTETFQSGGMYNVDNQVGKLNSLYKKKSNGNNSFIYYY